VLVTFLLFVLAYDQADAGYSLLVIGGQPHHLDLLRHGLAIVMRTLLFELKTRCLKGGAVFGMAVLWRFGRTVRWGASEKTLAD
jgi:hypothetical protein